MFQFVSPRLLSRVIWLLFPNTTSDLGTYLADVNIPFNCEFLVAQKEDGHAVVLTAVHRVSTSLPLQFYRFCNWTVKDGLICAPVGLYQRRNSLNGAVLKTAVKKVGETLVIRRLFSFGLSDLELQYLHEW
jgi:hypothetical protein